MSTEIGPAVDRRSRPPRGWNSWDCYGTTVTEAEVLANAEFLAEHLLASGYDTVVVDIQWYARNVAAGGYLDDPDPVLDEWGRPLPDPARFPSAADGGGFTALAERVHALGLRFGVHLMRGIPRAAVEAALPVKGTDITAADLATVGEGCTWNPDMWGVRPDHPAVDAWYGSVAELLASWGVDFVKADDMLWPYRSRDIESLSGALAGTGRDIELSLSPGVDMSVARADHLREHATMWRISNDLWDRWEDVEDMAQRLARWAPHARPGGWPDADMLPLGRIGIRGERGEDRLSRLTDAEQRTMLALWGIARSPFMLGGDLPTSPAELVGLLTDPVLLRVSDQGDRPRELIRDHDWIGWRSELPDGVAVAVINPGDEPWRRRIDPAAFGLAGPWAGRRAWSSESVRITDELVVELGPHDGALYELRPA